MALLRLWRPQCLTKVAALPKGPRSQMQVPSERRERVYRKPELRVLGDLAKLTNTRNNSRAIDGYYTVGTHT